MKLFFIIENNWPHASGGGYYAIFKFAEYMSYIEHDVVIYAVNDQKWIKESDTLRIIYRPKLPRARRVLRKLDKMLASFYHGSLLEKEVRAFEPDWIFGVLRDSAINAVDIGKKLNIPIANFIYETPAWLEDVGGEMFKRDYVGYHRKLWEDTREAYLASDVLLPNSELSGRYASEWLGGKEISEPIYPGLDPLETTLKEGVVTEEKNLLYIGRLSKLKKVDVLVKAVKSCTTKPTLHICGDGEEMNDLKMLASDCDRIHFHGFVSDDELWTRYQQCEILVYPTAFEGFGMPPMQAFSFKKPCIASDLPILKSIYEDYIDYTPMGDVQALRKKIDEMLVDRAYCRQRGQAGFDFVINRFTWAKAAERLEAVLSGRGQVIHQ